MKERHMIVLALVLTAAGAFAQNPGGQARRDAYFIQQTAQEVDRLGAQFGMLNENVDALAARVVRLENAPSADRELRDEIAAIKAQIAELQRRQNALKKEISDEITEKVIQLIKKIPAAQPPPPQPKPGPKPKSQPQVTGNYYEVEIEPGYTLSAIAQAYKTTVKRILDANPGLKPTNLKIGQKIIVPVD